MSLSSSFNALIFSFSSVFIFRLQALLGVEQREEAPLTLVARIIFIPSVVLFLAVRLYSSLFCQI